MYVYVLQSLAFPVEQLPSMPLAVTCPSHHVQIIICPQLFEEILSFQVS